MTLMSKTSRSFCAMYEELYAPSQQAAQKPSLEQMRDYRAKILGYVRDPENPAPDLQPSLQFTIPSTVMLRAKSNKTCFACLQAAPDHFLPCGHGYCPDCVKDFSEPVEETPYRYIFEFCVLCGPQTQTRYLKHVVRLDPRAAGVRILTLDGGGIRGILELEVLRRILEKVNLDLQISDLFDLVVGTSTGVLKIQSPW